MKVVHWAAIVVLILVSLMNLGVVADGPPVAVLVTGVVVGLAGLVGVYGLIRRTSWGPLAALAAGGAFLVTSVIGLFLGWQGSPIGITVSLVSLILTAIGESATLRRARVAPAK